MPNFRIERAMGFAGDTVERCACLRGDRGGNRAFHERPGGDPHSRATVFGDQIQRDLSAEDRAAEIGQDYHSVRCEYPLDRTHYRGCIGTERVRRVAASSRPRYGNISRDRVDEFCHAAGD
jgi:hypothetical protein